jgi:hypothetical protein
MVRIFLEAHASTQWPSVQGQMTRVSIKELKGIKTRYEADVRYSYMANGIEYSGSRIRASDGSFSRRDAIEDSIRGFIIGSPITVHFDPIDPSRSLLQPGAGATEYALLVIPIIMLAMGIIPLLVVFSMRKSTDIPETPPTAPS